MRRRQQRLDGDGASPLSRLTCAIDDFNDSREHGIGGGVREGQPQRQEAQAAAWCGVLDGTTGISTRVVDGYGVGGNGGGTALTLHMGWRRWHTWAAAH